MSELKRNQIEMQEKVQAEMHRFGLDALILTRAESIFYCTGYASRYAYEGGIGNTIAVMPKTGEATVICSQFESKTVSDCPDIQIVSYPIWMYIADFPDEGEKDTQPDLNRTIKMAVDVVKDTAPYAKNIGIDASHMPYRFMDYLTQVFERDNIHDCNNVLIEARTIKTDWEIKVLRENAKLAEQQMIDTASAIEVGMTEEDIINLFSINGLKQSKEVYGLRNAHTYSEYFSPAFVPRKHKLKDGDIVRLDGGIMRHGYCSDLGRTFVVGKNLDPERAALYETLWGAFDIAMEMIGPGVKAADVYDRMLARVQKDLGPVFKRGHFGHSTGCVRGEEYPFISNTNPGTFEPGMVFCVETPYYGSRLQTYNIEDTILITENGYERFTHAGRSLFWPEK